MALDRFRRIVRQIDFANDHVPPIHLSGNDHDGRILVVALTDGGQPVNVGGLTAKLLYNSDPGRKLGGFANMRAVAGAPTATFEVPVPSEVFASRSTTLCVRVEDGSTYVCSRNIMAEVDAPLVAADSPEAKDKLDALIQAMEDARAQLASAEEAVRDIEVHGNVITDPTGQDIVAAIQALGDGVQPVARGGTGARTAAEACWNLQAYYLGSGTRNLVAGDNMDNVTEPGVYSVAWTVNKSIANFPVTDANRSALVVVRRTANDIIQEVTAYTSSDLERYTRYISSNLVNKTPWRQADGVDSIVAEGVTSGWHWTKWANGMTLLRGKHTVTPSSSGVAYLRTPNFPFSVTDAIPMVRATQGSNVSCWVGHCEYSSTAVATYVNLTNTQDVVLGCAVYGRWK